MPNQFGKEEGAEGAHAYDAAVRKIIDNDPDVQAVIRSVWGNTTRDQRPSDTPKHLEQKNKAASNQITQILKAKGIELPDRTFINPRSGTIEGHRGWSGLSGWQRTAIIAAAAATGVGAGMALAGGGAAAGAAGTGGAAASTGSGIGVTSGLGTLSGVGATGVGAGGTAIGGGSGLTSILAKAGVNAAKTKLQGGSWKDAAISGGTGAVTGGLGGGGGSMNWMDLLKQTATNPSTYTTIAGSLAKGKQSGREAENSAANNTADFQARERMAAEQAMQNRAGLDLRQREFTKDSRNDNYSKALRSALVMNMKDVSVNRPKGIPHIAFTGGARPSSLGPEGKAAGAEMNRQAMAKLLSGEQFDPMAPIERTSPAEYKGAGAVENILGGVGAVGQAMEGQQAQNTQAAYQNQILEQIRKLSEPPQQAGASTPPPPAAPPPSPFQLQLPQKKNPWEVTF